MYSINVKNNITGKVWGQGTFYTGRDLDYIREQEREGVFGKPDRWVREDLRESYELLLTPLETREVEGITEYHYASDYTFEMSLSQTEANATIAAGIRCRKCCEEIHNYVTGYNLVRNISTTLFQQTFNTVFQLILANRPRSLKTAVHEIPVDGVLLTQDLKDNIMSIFTKYGF